MTLDNGLALLGGLALFLYGMQMMSSGLEAAAGNRIKHIFEKLTSNPILGVAVGALITALIQSSSGTTVMVVGFVNSGMMTLNQAVWIIMGANIGTTITAQLIALDIARFAPLFAIIGVVMIVFIKAPKVHRVGQIVAGMGVLFMGMKMMSAAVSPLREIPEFIDLMTRFSNPLFGLLAGMLFTAVIQSSAASIGILQALASSGVIGLPSAVYVLFGQNIGTCITAVLASFGTSRNAKRTTIIHVLFNVIGAAIFTVICMVTPFTAWMQSLNPANPAAQIANVHTIFNLATTAVLLPFGGLLARMSVKLLPDKAHESSGEMHLQYLSPAAMKTDGQIGSIAIVISQLTREISRMLDMARANVFMAFVAVEEGNPKLLKKIGENEDYVDFLNKEISRYISNMMTLEMPEQDSQTINAYFKISSDIERISDHADNLANYAAILEADNTNLSAKATDEVRRMKDISMSAMRLLGADAEFSGSRLETMQTLEKKMDEMSTQYRTNQMQRMKSGDCSGEACVIYAEMLTDFERIGDHIMNIVEEYEKFSTPQEIPKLSEAITTYA